MLDDFIAASQAREEHYQNRHGEEEEDTEPPESPPFSVDQIIRDRGADYVRQAIHFTWDEFKDLFSLVETALTQSGRGRSRKLEPINQFFIFLLHTTSGCTIRTLAVNLSISPSLAERTIYSVLDAIEEPLMAMLPRADGAAHCRETFEDFPHAYAIVDASPVFICRPLRHQQQYYSGKYKRHCVKVQALVTPDGQCVHISKAYRGRTHDKAIFDASNVADFLAYSGRHGDRSVHRAILADLGYIGITRTCASAILPYRRKPGRELREEQREHNRKLSRARILVENFFARWKTIFGIVHQVYRGNLKKLGAIIRVTVAMTDWHIRRHPLRRAGGEELTDESDREQPEPAVPLDEDSGISD
jgi:transposase